MFSPSHLARTSPHCRVLGLRALVLGCELGIMVYGLGYWGLGLLGFRALFGSSALPVLLRVVGYWFLTLTLGRDYDEQDVYSLTCCQSELFIKQQPYLMS